MPVVTTYQRPRNRVLINSIRNPNPFFHLFESLWMLAGRNDLAFLKKFVSAFGQFSDDGETLHGAYGYRWRNWFGHDQLDGIINELKNSPKSRRCVLQMWDGAADPERAASGGKDVPCNVTAFFDTIGDRLNLNVMCRSNDIVLGAYGANAVHFSFLLEYISLMACIPMGVYRQFSTNFHLYTDLYPNLKFPDQPSIEALATTVWTTDPYTSSLGMGIRNLHNRIESPPLFQPGQEQGFHEDLEAFMEFDLDDMETPFFQDVVAPMYRVWEAWNVGEFFTGARSLTLFIKADDWRMAAQDWLSIRERNPEEKING